MIAAADSGLHGLSGDPAAKDKLEAHSPGRAQPVASGAVAAATVFSRASGRAARCHRRIRALARGGAGAARPCTRRPTGLTSPTSSGRPCPDPVIYGEEDVLRAPRTSSAVAAHSGRSSSEWPARAMIPVSRAVQPLLEAFLTALPTHGLGGRHGDSELRSDPARGPSHRSGSGHRWRHGRGHPGGTRGRGRPPPQGRGAREGRQRPRQGRPPRTDRYARTHLRARDRDLRPERGPRGNPVGRDDGGRPGRREPVDLQWIPELRGQAGGDRVLSFVSIYLAGGLMGHSHRASTAHTASASGRPCAPSGNATSSRASRPVRSGGVRAGASTC